MRTMCVAMVVLALAGPVSAQKLTLEFEQGRVSLDAAEVPVRTILEEWARLGGTRVVNGEKVTGAPLTLRLEKVPEAQALEIILRNVAGYMAAPRALHASGASAYDRILVMPTSSAPAPAAAANPRTGNGMAGTQRGVRPGFQPPQMPDDQPVAPDESDTGVNEPAFAFPQPGQNPFQGIGQPGPFGTPVMPGAQPQTLQFGQGAEGQAITINPTPPQAMPVLQFPGMPGGPPAQGGFGVVGAPMPGVVTQPGTPPPGIRPPGTL